MHSVEEIIYFVEEFTGAKGLNPDDDLFKKHRIRGDDFHEMMEKYCQEYKVNMDGYLWYFHADEEGQSIGRFFFKPPNERVLRIPITPLLLTEFANSGKWSIKYPPHTLPKRRWDLVINAIIFVLVFSMLIWSCLK